MTDRTLGALERIIRLLDQRVQRLESQQRWTIPPGREDEYQRRQASVDRLFMARDKEQRQ